MSAPTINPITPQMRQTPFVDPKTGLLTDFGWFALFALQQGAQQALNQSFTDTVDLEIVAGAVTLDLSQSGPLGSFRLIGTGAAINVGVPENSQTNVVNGGSLIRIVYDQPAAGGAPKPVFPTGDGGFMPEFNTIAITATANTRTTYLAGYDSTLGLWSLVAFRTGDPI